jgi:melibiose permease
MKLTFKNKFGFALGAVGKDIVYMLVSSYLLYYYNAVLGVSSAFIGSVLMLARVFDALNDPIMGIIVAKTKTKYGRFRP